MKQDELRAALRQVFIKHKRYVPTDFLDDLTKAAAQDKEKAVGEARINELGRAHPHLLKQGSDSAYYLHRMSQLTGTTNKGESPKAKKGE